MTPELHAEEAADLLQIAQAMEYGAPNPDPDGRVHEYLTFEQIVSLAHVHALLALRDDNR